MTYQALVFAELRELLQGRTVSEVDALYAVGARASIRAAILKDNLDALALNLSLGTFQPELVDWRALRIVICGSRDDGKVEKMPIACVLDANGQGHCILPPGAAVTLWELRVPQSCVPLEKTASGVYALPILRSPTSRAADSAIREANVGEALDDYPNIIAFTSDDRRVTALAEFEQDYVLLTFEVSADCEGYAVEWAVGLGDHVDDSGVSRPTIRRDMSGLLASEPVRINLALSRQLYFELIN